jgi:hypothetical protein
VHRASIGRVHRLHHHGSAIRPARRRQHLPDGVGD